MTSILVRTFLFALVCVVSSCGGPRPVTEDIHARQACGATQPDLVFPHATAGDELCAAQADCSETSGQPTHQGCPSTCKCLCFNGACYQGACTAISCSGPPVYR